MVVIVGTLFLLRMKGYREEHQAKQAGTLETNILPIRRGSVVRQIAPASAPESQ
jgi:hypothetical protein